MQTTELAGNIAASDMSILSLIGNADIVVKLVMLLLVCASFWSWTIIFDKFFKFRDIKKKTDKFERVFWSGQLLDQLYEKVKSRADHPMAIVFVAAMHEWGRQSGRNSGNNLALIIGVKDRINQSMLVALSREVNKLEQNIGFLASVASCTPFVGLFGTVWGIMHSFQSIAASKNTTLAVVAPGIAEALLATAIGLVAAIPAGIFYNILTGQLNSFSARVEDFSTELSALLSREIDEGM
jgi:biopolymer transport protein TolQ